MRLPIRPGRRSLTALAAGFLVVCAALIAGLPVATASVVAGVWALALVAAAIADWAITRHRWRLATPALRRRLPPAFAVGVPQRVPLALEATGADRWQCDLYDHADPLLITHGLPLRLTVDGGTQVETTYTVTPTRRGPVTFAPADVRIESRWGLVELVEQLGAAETRRVYPDFAQIARYAWLAGDRRLQEIGIKTYHQRGEGTDFKQLSEYRVGDSVRHIDWKATLRLDKPVVREFQDERDQCVLLLVDCGRRMRADDRVAGIGATHFDQVLNAVVLLAYVALQQGDAVGVMTFGTPQDEEVSLAPRKGAAALNALMNGLYGVQPTPAHSDYVTAAQDLLRRQRKRALVVLVTNFRDEDNDELDQALRLLRSRHLVLLASLRERIAAEMASQPLVSAEAAIEVASAQMYEQSRRDAFTRLADRAALMVDAVPERLGVDLVNRYHAVKRAGLI